MRRVKPVHPGLKNERLFLQKERTDTARRLESDECDNGLQEGGGGGESRKGTASSVVDGRRGLEGGAVDAFVAGPGKRTGVFRCSHGRQSDCQAQRAPPTRASSVQRPVGVPWPTPLHARRPAASVLIARAWR